MLKSLIEITKGLSLSIVGLASASVLLFIMYLNLIEIKVVVNSVQLPEEMIAQGIPPNALTKNSVLAMPNRVRQMIESAVSTEIGLPLRDGSCYLSYVSVSSNPALRASRERRFDEIELDFDLPDWSISGNGLTIGRFARYVKNWLNLDFIEVTPYVITNQGVSTLQVDVYGPDREYKSVGGAHIGSKSDIENALTDGLILIFAPDLMASIEKPRSPEDLTKHLALAEDFLRDSNKSTWIKLLQIETLGKVHLQQADQLKLALRAEDIALDILSDERLHELGSFTDPAIDILTSTLANAVSTQLLYLEDFPDASQYENRIETLFHYRDIYIEYARQVLSDQDGSVMSIYHATVILWKFGEAEEAVKGLKRLFTVAAETSQTSDDTFFWKALVVQSLIEMGAWNDALRFGKQIDTDLTEYKGDVRGDIRNLTGALAAILDYSNENAKTALKYLSSNAVIENPCISLFLLSWLDSLNRSKNVPVVSKEEVNTVLSAFLRAESVGLKSFRFYNLWGSTLSTYGKFEQAAARYREARDYVGDVSWSYLNEGIALRNLGKPREAKELFEASLNEGVTASAVMQLLSVLDATEQHTYFLEIFESYYIYLGFPGADPYFERAGQLICELDQDSEGLIERFRNKPRIMNSIECS